jgi:hypothetical protein
MSKTQPLWRAINRKGFLKDIGSGMTETELRAKYGLTVQDFDRVAKWLVHAEVVARAELQEGQQLSDSQVIRAFVQFCKDIKLID